MRFLVDETIFETFPDALVGVLVCRGIDNRTKDGEAETLSSMLHEAAALARGALEGRPPIEHPHIVCWREAYRAFGAKPKKYPSSIENLLRRAVKGEDPRHINKLVDLYNVVSLEHLVPAGGEDLASIQGDIRLTKASVSEPPVRLLGESEERAPKPGEVIYTDDVGAICRRWNWKEADRTKLTEDTKEAVLVLEALPPLDYAKLEAAMDELASLVREHLGGALARSMLDRDRPETALA
jgi:DNA/RNA-binding domain of Phe-tRNA-synthetase-like protein